MLKSAQRAAPFTKKAVISAITLSFIESGQSPLEHTSATKVIIVGGFVALAFLF